ncbi:MAG: hypothetical protein AAB348_03075 [Patescibacteria group bacterium]
MLKNISLHPKLLAVLDCVANLALLWWLKQASSWLVIGMWIFFRLVLWAIALRLVYHTPEISRLKHFVSLLFLSFGVLSYLLFIEWDLAWKLFGATFIFFSAFSFWILPASNVQFVSFVKPHLRWKFIMCVIGMAGIFQAVGAITSFQIAYTVSVWVWIFITAFLSSIIAGWWWREYGIEFSPRFWKWVGAWFVLTFELVWVVQILPLGHLVSSVLLIWFWYMTWLLARFNLSQEGINWKKQIVFLGSNVVLLLTFLIFIVRWK